MWVREGLKGELISFTSRSGLWLDGILYEAVGSALGTVVHVHGSYGNFYTNRWLRSMGHVYTNQALNFFVINLATHDGLAEGYRNLGEDVKEKFGYVGHAVTPYRTYVDDIFGALDFVRTISSVIILQGHSLGCDRILGFAALNEVAFPLVFLSPADTPQLVRNYYAPTEMREVMNQLRQTARFSEPYDWLPIEACGVRQPPDEVYQMPMTYSAVKSWLELAWDELIQIGSPSRGKLHNAGLVYLGGQDGYLTCSVEDMFTFFEKRIPRLTRLYVADGGHEMDGCVDYVARSAAEWIVSSLE